MCLITVTNEFYL